MEGPKNIKDEKKDMESPELKEELTDNVLKGVSGGATPYQKGVFKHLGGGD